MELSSSFLFTLARSRWKWGAPRIDWEQYHQEGGSSEIANDGDVVHSRTPTLLRDPGIGELVVYDAAGKSVISSGLVDEADFTIPAGVLQTGGQYEWSIPRPRRHDTVGKASLHF